MFFYTFNPMVVFCGNGIKITNRRIKLFIHRIDFLIDWSKFLFEFLFEFLFDSIFNNSFYFLKISMSQ
jgi:hypothetical protein